MEFLDISSLGTAYRYAIKIEQKLKQKMRQFGPGNPSQKNPGKGTPTRRTKDRAKKDCLRKTSPGRKQRRTPKRQRKIPGSGATSIRAPGITLLIVTQRSRLVAEVKASESDVGSDSESEPERGRWIIDAEPSATFLPPSSSPVNQMSQRKASTFFIHRCG
jgi:hypothetical protein